MEKSNGKNIDKEAYREKLIRIFTEMCDANRLKFWCQYISAIENGEE